MYVIIRAYSYSKDGRGAIILTKVVLGSAYQASAFNEVMSCPPGHNSVRCPSVHNYDDDIDPQTYGFCRLSSTAKTECLMRPSFIPTTP